MSTFAGSAPLVHASTAQHAGNCHHSFTMFSVTTKTNQVVPGDRSDQVPVLIPPVPKRCLSIQTGPQNPFPAQTSSEAQRFVHVYATAGLESMPGWQQSSPANAFLGRMQLHFKTTQRRSAQTPPCQLFSHRNCATILVTSFHVGNWNVMTFREGRKGRRKGGLLELSSSKGLEN